MKRGWCVLWCVLWKGSSCTVFLDAKGEWTLDPSEAFVFKSWVVAKASALAGGFKRELTIGRCWYE